MQLAVLGAKVYFSFDSKYARPEYPHQLKFADSAKILLKLWILWLKLNFEIKIKHFAQIWPLLHIFGLHGTKFNTDYFLSRKKIPIVWPTQKIWKKLKFL